MPRCPRMQPDTKVMITSLEREVELNGQEGRIVRDFGDRYEVFLSETKTTVRVRGDKITPLHPMRFVRHVCRLAHEINVFTHDHMVARYKKDDLLDGIGKASAYSREVLRPHGHALRESLSKIVLSQDGRTVSLYEGSSDVSYSQLCALDAQAEGEGEVIHFGVADYNVAQGVCMPDVSFVPRYFVVEVESDDRCFWFCNESSRASLASVAHANICVACNARKHTADDSDHCPV